MDSRKLGLERAYEAQRRREEERRLLEEVERDVSLAPPQTRKSYPVRFHALWHRIAQPDVWQTLLIYVYSGPFGVSGARVDFHRRMSAPRESYDDSSSMATKRIRRGTEISIHPELAGFRFNPPFTRVHWLEDWHCIEFRMQAVAAMSGSVGQRVDGRVAFFVGPLQIGETGLYAIIGQNAPYAQSPTEPPEMHARLWEETGSSNYRAIFVSYSHEDSSVVNQLERAYRALGDDYLRDVAVLRSGEPWNPALLKRIQKADVFQLCWSRAAKRSSYVEQEWRYALHLRRASFIRPMYWQVPLPEPPEELREIHFSFVPFDDDAPS